MSIATYNRMTCSSFSVTSETLLNKSNVEKMKGKTLFKSFSKILAKQLCEEVSIQFILQIVYGMLLSIFFFYDINRVLSSTTREKEKTHILTVMKKNVFNIKTNDILKYFEKSFENRPTNNEQP